MTEGELESFEHAGCASDDRRDDGDLSACLSVCAGPFVRGIAPVLHGAEAVAMVEEEAAAEEPEEAVKELEEAAEEAEEGGVEAEEADGEGVLSLVRVSVGEGKNRMVRPTTHCDMCCMRMLAIWAMSNAHIICRCMCVVDADGSVAWWIHTLPPPLPPRQVRRMLAHCGLPVVNLKRLAYGACALGGWPQHVDRRHIHVPFYHTRSVHAQAHAHTHLRARVRAYDRPLLARTDT